jgi:hypothetical protein
MTTWELLSLLIIPGVLGLAAFKCVVTALGNLYFGPEE